MLNRYISMYTWKIKPCTDQRFTVRQGQTCNYSQCAGRKPFENLLIHKTLYGLHSNDSLYFGSNCQPFLCGRYNL